MNRTQTLRAAEIMSKLGLDNWRIESRDAFTIYSNWVRIDSWQEVSSWNWAVREYRAVRIEKVETKIPLVVEFYKIGMQVITKSGDVFLVYRRSTPTAKCISCIADSNCQFTMSISPEEIDCWRWPGIGHNNISIAAGCWEKAYKITTHEEVVEKIEIDNEV